MIRMALIGLRKTSFAILWFVIFWIIGLIGISLFLNINSTSDTSSKNSYQQGYLKGQEAGKKVRVPLTVITGLLAITGSVTGILPGTKTSKKIKEIEPKPEILESGVEEK
ncbi:hypothetical protein Cri9333_0390 [Crinalium epipsammum PCC 9333]|uniref:Uncharacterized protein n=1 Tax=Crinalium epipsammum PCC 9333 TaxID=1173022 RepID=K9VUX9_9CYAN|nr:hypothetical protein [Crinalium epipsammum]AFZ11364.1 hypothetical protein Cri9333_0390 [Crinalium epipsammum PCC 9333]